MHRCCHCFVDGPVVWRRDSNFYCLLTILASTSKFCGHYSGNTATWQDVIYLSDSDRLRNSVVGYDPCREALGNVPCWCHGAIFTKHLGESTRLSQGRRAPLAIESWLWATRFTNQPLSAPLFPRPTSVFHVSVAVNPLLCLIRPSASVWGYYLRILHFNQWPDFVTFCSCRCLCTGSQLAICRMVICSCNLICLI